ncbi:MAG: ATP-binding protein [Candidatus Aminicenantes bacterium]|nr:ATP-binding protein [Candidatus Aminicenantes bacterium]
MTIYRQREISVTITHTLKNMPVVVLSGMRQTGKSTLLLNQPELRKRKYLNFDDFAVLEAARNNPENLLSGKEDFSIDEAQKFPEILTVIKRQVDKDRRPGKFLLTGSANFLLLKNISESLAGRAVYLTLQPFTRREIIKATDQIPALIHFLKHRDFPADTASPVRWTEILKGGMPPVCLGEVSDRKLWFQGYEQTYLERDIRSLSQVADLVTFRHFLQLAALRNGRLLKQSELARDGKLNVMTASRYLSLIEISFVLRRLPPYFRNPSSRLIKSPKLYFSDSGLAAHLAGQNESTSSGPFSGVLLECYVLQNLEGILAAHSPGARIYFWHVQGRHEVDFIAETSFGTIAIEIKNSSRWQEKDLSGLKVFLSTTPSCLAGILAYTGSRTVSLGDKIWAIPIPLLLS